ncbi:hypothetical protein BpHYR1_046850 [Brachionus plicatilis]|uniref:Uncharacterized protein n=1 Tax=Brachionus plicatilis TaxID=10195 RepID=A0A3M7T8K5_BRAPC|nr:hypothetical protein BpHYR1_046850 [Brachionus plicatilis]
MYLIDNNINLYHLKFCNFNRPVKGLETSVFKMIARQTKILIRNSYFSKKNINEIKIFGWRSYVSHRIKMIEELKLLEAQDCVSTNLVYN